MTIIKEIFKQILVVVGFILLALFVLSYTHPDTPLVMFKQIRTMAIIYTFIVSIPVAFDSRLTMPKSLYFLFTIGFIPLIAVIIGSFFQSRIVEISSYDFVRFTLNWFNYGCCID